jgi:hypothetical protein
VAPALPPLPEEDHECLECAFAYTQVSVEDAIEVIRSVPDDVRTVVLRRAGEHLRSRPVDGAWSALEYLCHLRDVYAAYTIRLYRTRVEDVPILEPMLNDLRVVRFRYNERDCGSLLAELGDNVAGFLDETARNTEETWRRSARRLPGEERSGRWLLRQAAHEGLHHTRDIARVLEQVGAQQRRPPRR